MGLFGRAWGMSDFDLTKLRLIEYLAEQDTWSVPRLPEWASEPGTPENAHARDAMRVLHDYGYLDHYSIDGGGDPSGMLNAHGRSVWRTIEEIRSDGRARGREVRDALLHWLEEQYRNGAHSPKIDQFSKSKLGKWYGEPFLESEIGRASMLLKQMDLIDGTGSAEGIGLLLAKITAKGIVIVENGRSVNDPEPRAVGDYHVTINQSGDYAVAQAGGHGSVQNFTHTVTEDHKEQILGFANALDELVQAKNLADAAGFPAHIRDAAESRDPSSVARVLKGTRDYLEQHAATGLGALVLVELSNLMHAIGLS
jgi:hypothetical protein